MQITGKTTIEVVSSKSKERWEEVVGVITLEQWKRILELGPLVSVSPSQKVAHLFLLHIV